MKKPIIGVLSFVLIICLIIIIVLAVLLSKQEKQCITPECISFAASVMSRMNLSVDPCDDFYEYACGNWLETIELPDGVPRYSTFSLLAERNDELLMKRISSPGNDYMGQDSSAVRNAKAYYNACLNRTAIDDLGAEPLLEFIRELGSCPLMRGVAGVGTYDANRWSLEGAVKSLHVFETNPLFLIYVSPDLTTDYYIMWFYQSGLSLFNNQEFYIIGNSTNTTERYHDGWVNYVSELFTLLGATGDVKAEVEKIYQFEVELAKIFDPPEARQNMTRTYNKMTVADLKNLTKSWFNMGDFLESFVGEPVPDSEEVIIKSPDYYRKLAVVIENADRNVLANYVVARAVQSLAKFLSSVFVDAWMKYKRDIMGGAREPEPKKDCLRHLNSFMYDLMGGLYIEEEFNDPKFKVEIELQLENIKRAFSTRINNLDWMDEETKQRAQQKVSTLTAQVAYPDIVKDPQQLNDKFRQFEFTDSFFNNIRLGDRLGIERNLAKRNKVPDENEWSSGANNVNAYYHPMFNRMVFLAGILNPPFYGTHYPTAMNYGAIGTVMGHEMTHGFDVRGRQLDHEGKLVNWWSASSEEAFKDRAQCLVDQYDGFVIGDTHVNGQLTVGENMADNGGIKSAYDGYVEWARSNEDTYDSHSLPGLDMKSNQLFFLGFAQSWCSYITDQYAIVTVATDTHTQSKYRVIGTLQNNREFAEAFKCPVGSWMNPETKCVTW